MRVNIHIRETDKPEWDKIKNKSLWIHNQLNHLKIMTNPVNQTTSNIRNKTIKLKTIGDRPIDLCEHFQTKGSCLQKKCKYS